MDSRGYPKLQKITLTALKAHMNWEKENCPKAGHGKTRLNYSLHNMVSLELHQ